ncbi:MAG: hypothetical protein ACLQVD_11370 [Capsulimonadaceae bacterium]
MEQTPPPPPNDASRTTSSDLCDLLAPVLDSLSTAAEISGVLKEWHARINQPGAGRDPGLLTQNTVLVDAVLRRIYKLAIERTGSSDAAEPEMVIVATGGYGRRELCPYSDVDVTFIPAREDDDRLNVIIKDMFQLVMDVFLYGGNLKVGYAYRLIGDLNQLDHQTQNASRGPLFVRRQRPV